MPTQRSKIATAENAAWPLAAAISLCVITFALDLGVPVGVAAGVPYVLPVIVTLWIPGVASTAAFSVAALALTMTGYFLSPPGGAFAEVAANRGLAVASVVAATVLVLLSKHAEAARKKDDRRFRRIADTIPGILWAMDPNYSLIYMNAYLRALIGLGPDEDLGRRWIELVHPDDRARVLQLAAETSAAVRPFEAEFRIVSASGDYADILARGRPYFDESGGLTGYVATGLDITEQKRAEAKLRDSEAFLTRAQELASVGSWIWEPGVPGVQWSDEMYRIVGVDPDSWSSVIDSFADTIVHPLDRRDFVAGWDELLRTKSGTASHYRIVRPDGEIRFVHAECDVIVGDDGEILRILGTTQDVTERRLAEQALSESRERLAYAERIAGLGHTEWDVRADTQVWSDGFFRILGMEPGEVVPSRDTFADLVILPSERARLVSRRDAIAAGDAEPGSSYRVLRKDGVVRELQVNGQVFKDADGEVLRVFATAQDVTELREAERALRASEERLELAARGANDGLWDWADLTAHELWMSPRYYELLGYEPGEFEPTAESFLGAVHPDDADSVGTALERHLEGGPLYDVECRLQTKSGDYRWYRVRGAAIFDADRKPLRLAGSLQDVHARQTAELVLAHQKDQLQHLAAQVALVAEKERRRIGAELHDRTVQNLGLTKVKLGALRAVAQAAGVAQQYQELADLVDATIQDARALLSEISPPVLTELGFEAAVDWLAERAESQYGVQCSVSDDGETRVLDEDAQLVLFQAVRELLANIGKHARAGSAHVRISGGSSQVVVRVEDDGVGFEAGDVAEKAVDEGGYGLFSIRERLRMLGGVLQIDSRPETGTAVTVSVPIRH